MNASINNVIIMINNRYVVTYQKKDRKLMKESLFAFFASLYLGFAMFFIMLSFGLNL